MKMCQISALVVGLTALLGGCAVGPNYHSPQSAIPPNWSEPQLSGTTNSAVQVADWWKTFNDPELDSLIERAVAANHDLRIAEGRLREARAFRSGAIWDFGPTINASGSYANQRRSENAETSTAPNQRLNTDLYDAHFDASW